MPKITNVTTTENKCESCVPIQPIDKKLEELELKLRNDLVDKDLSEYSELDKADIGAESYVYVDHKHSPKKLELSSLVPEPSQAKQSDWAETDPTKLSYIKNKPVLGELSKKDLVNVDDLGPEIKGEFERIHNDIEDLDDSVVRLGEETTHLSDDITHLTANKQDLLVSGENIKTINHQNILGSGNLDIGGGSSNVQWNQVVTTGTKIADITINGNKTDVFAPNGGGRDFEVNDSLSLDNNILSIKNYNQATQGQMLVKDSTQGLVWTNPLSPTQLNEAVAAAQSAATQSGNYAASSGNSASEALTSANNAHVSEVNAEAIQNAMMAYFNEKFWWGTLEEYNNLETIKKDSFYFVEVDA